ncbi:MAG: Two component regulator propeller [Elusimicrobia bacterium ADurb.Bin231]|nr:MAG: Two component regulator propeller [Elusimicrobia bacterium ADurb.Bin231]
MKKFVSLFYCFSLLTVLRANVVMLKEKEITAKEWTVYRQPTNYNCLAVENEVLWIGTDIGVLEVDTKELTYRFHNDKDGLAGNDVRAIEIDNTGAKWFGTFGNGVSKYDGSSWTTYNMANSGLASDYVKVIAPDPLGNIWFGFSTYQEKQETAVGTCRFDGKNWKRYTMDTGLVDNRVQDILITDAGKIIWFATFQGVSKYETETDTWTTLNRINSGLPDNEIGCISSDERGNIWFGTENAGIIKFDGTSWTGFCSENGLYHDDVTDVLPDPTDGKIWVIYDYKGGGATVYDGQAWTSYDISNTGLSGDYIGACVIDQSGNKWFINDSWKKARGGNPTTPGITKFDGKTWTKYVLSNMLPSNTMQCAFVDSSGVLWFGTSSAGAIKMKDGIWSVCDTSTGLADNTVFDICEDKNGFKWFATLHGLSKYDGKNWTTFNRSNSGLTENYIKCIASDNKNSIWCGTYYGGVAVYNGKKWTSYTTGNSSLTHNYVTAIMIEPDGKKWMGTYGKGVCVYDGKKWKTYNVSNSGLVNDTVNAIFLDSKGNKWIATSAGISVFDGKNWKSYTTKNGLSSLGILDLTADFNGAVWAGTYNGAAVFSGEKWKMFNVRNSDLPTETVTCVVVDNTDVKWFGTDKAGIVKFTGTRK